MEWRNATNGMEQRKELKSYQWTGKQAERGFLVEVGMEQLIQELCAHVVSP